MRFICYIGTVATGAMFGLWQESPLAAAFMFSILWFAVTCIDFAKEPKT